MNLSTFLSRNFAVHCRSAVLRCPSGGQPTSKVFIRKKSDWRKMVAGVIDDGFSQWPKLRVGIVGAPLEEGQPHSGVGLAPDLIRSTGIAKQLGELGHDVIDTGNIHPKPVDPNEPMNSTNVTAFCQELSERVSEVLSSGRFCLTLGGDHAVGLATVHGHLKTHPDACLLWVDAHADINTTLTSDTGHMHGMPVSFQIKEIAERHPATLPQMDWLSPRLNPHRIAYIGVRMLDPPERAIIDRLGIPCYSTREIDELGIREVVRQALERVNPNMDRPIHVSFDIDALDPTEAPATGTPVRGGLTLREGMTLLEDCFDTGCLAAMDLVEVNTKLGTEQDAEKTLEAARLLILAAMGNYCLGKRAPGK